MSITLDLQPYVRLTDDQFFELCQRHPDLKLERTSEGKIVIMPPTGGDTGHRNADLTSQLFQWARADGRGLVFDSSTGFKLPNGAERGPDAAWVSRQRWETLTPQQRKGFPPLCPEFVVELLSPSESRTELQAKLREYLANGAQLGWLLDPMSREAEIYRPGREVEVLRRPSGLSGEDLLPGFWLDLRGIL